MKKRYENLIKQSKELNDYSALEEFETNCIPENIKVTSNGEENIYFVYADNSGSLKNGFCKCL